MVQACNLDDEKANYSIILKVAVSGGLIWFLLSSIDIVARLKDRIAGLLITCLILCAGFVVIVPDGRRRSAVVGGDAVRSNTPLSLDGTDKAVILDRGHSLVRHCPRR